MTYIPGITKAPPGLWEMRSLQNVSKDQPQRVKVSFAPYTLSETLPEYLRPTQVVSQKCAIKNPNIHRAFWKVKNILINQLFWNAEPIVRNLRDACAREKITVSPLTFSLSHEWVRDCMAIKTDGEMLLPSDLNFDEAFAETVRHLTGNPHCSMQGMVAASQTTRELIRSNQCLRVAPFYFEGGNLIQTFDPETGSVCYLSGASNLLYSFLNAEVTFAGVEEDLLKFMRETEKQITPSSEEIKKMKSRLESTGLLEGFSEEQRLWLAKFAHFAIVYVKKMMEEALEAPVIVIGDPLESPPDFHLDLFLVSTPQFIGIQNPMSCMRLIENISQNRDLTDNERQRLKIYHEQALAENIKHGKKLNVICDDLTEAGFRVLPLPGGFSADDNIAVNFLNGLAGLGGDDLPFYVTNGSGHPVDRYLREAFAAQMREQGVERVYFVGREEEQDRNLPAMKYDSAELSLEQLGGGIHCRVQTVNELASSGRAVGQKRWVMNTADDPISVSLPRFFGKILKRLL